MRRLLALITVLVLAAAACDGELAGTPMTQLPTPTAAVSPDAQPTVPPTPASPPAQPLPSPDAATPDAATPGAATPGAPATGTGACRLLTVDEVGAVMGGPVSVSESSDVSCTYSAQGTLAFVNVRVGTGETLEAARLILSGPEDLAVAGSPAVFGELVGHLLYVEQGGQTLVLHAIWEQDREAARGKLIQLAEMALPSFLLP